MQKQKRFYTSSIITAEDIAHFPEDTSAISYSTKWTQYACYQNTFWVCCWCTFLSHNPMNKVNVKASRRQSLCGKTAHSLGYFGSCFPPSRSLINTRWYKYYTFYANISVLTFIPTAKTMMFWDISMQNFLQWALGTSCALKWHFLDSCLNTNPNLKV